MSQRNNRRVHQKPIHRTVSRSFGERHHDGKLIFDQCKFITRGTTSDSRSAASPSGWTSLHEVGATYDGQRLLKLTASSRSMSVCASSSRERHHRSAFSDCCLGDFYCEEPADGRIKASGARPPSRPNPELPNSLPSMVSSANSPTSWGVEKLKTCAARVLARA